MTVYPEETVTDADGNQITRPSAVGILSRAVMQPLSSSEVSDGGRAHEPVTRYRLRLVGWQGDPLGPRSVVEWNGGRYAIDGYPMDYHGSRRTRHTVYQLIRK
ncbi:hypothetical protein BB734_24055 [Mycobacterium avium subsp. hominissuis]|uniref:Head-to-tail stopper n=2 Tax=Mycobacterium avium TaxID=1764 RepID=A0A2A3L0R5_MYCAV|nr:putative gp19 [Mycobacterium avium MAV_120709_2344]PBA24809.1 hypothetical protein CKJ66_21655 [Mycobacterium avium]PBD10938.1 hypothetical protein BI295_22620 [Mycobacterium avium subsp. hominissuis]PBA39711.1 hypothetical protein CKJ63_20070 [Mycobacterium avium]PBA44494.1 hypothetical protein CKJ62_19760 [Mycobacterium avium]